MIQFLFAYQERTNNTQQAQNCILNINIFKILHGLAPPPVGECIQQKDSSGRATRAATREDCVVPFRRSKFGQTVSSELAANYWNCLPTELRESTSYLSFKFTLKRLKLIKTAITNSRFTLSQVLPLLYCTYSIILFVSLSFSFFFFFFLKIVYFYVFFVLLLLLM